MSAIETEELAITLEEYRARLARIRREAKTEGEARKRILEIVAEKAKRRDLGDFDPVAILRQMRDGEIPT